MITNAPRFDVQQAARIARDAFGIDGDAHTLPSERDQNFLLTDSGGPRAVLKIANASERSEILDAQQAALTHVAPHVSVCPRVIPAANGQRVSTVTGTDGREHLMWAVSYLPGIALGNVKYKSRALLEDFGRSIATLGRSLATFDHPAIHRDFYWDLANARSIVDEYRALISDATLGAAIDTLVDRFDRHVRLDQLPRRAVHADLNDYNVLVGGSLRHPDAMRVSGIVDFGDMVHSYGVGDLAIAAAYMLLDSIDPLATLAALVRGHTSVSRLSEDELQALFGLSTLRLCASACIAAHQMRERPDNHYLDVSQAAIRRTLPTLANTPFGLATAVAREASGLEPSPTGARVREWLTSHPTEFAPVMPHDLRVEPVLVLDLSASGSLSSASSDENAEPLLTARVDAAMAEAGVRYSIGRYDEPRLLYSSPLFAPDVPFKERRTIHIGLDIFAPAGTPVFAPLGGVVYAFADNSAPLDYGPVIILRHDAGGVTFFTLYGHLSRESLQGLTVGKAISKGEQVATLGEAAVNGGWTPHLHLQVYTDLLDLEIDVPGVAAPSQRAVWRSISPDANLLVGVPAEVFPPIEPTKSETLATRRRLFGHNLSIAYRDPLKIVRGRGQYLFDESARRYVDAYNNVPHVGHAHPRVIEAGLRQMKLLNTNTRYLSDIVNDYSERLTALFPAPLDVCYLVNSASEANELALRLARAYTRQKDMVVLEAAYHGNTTGLIDLSPYKHAGPGGSGAPDWVHTVPIPDVYRGEFTSTDPNAGSKYAAHVERAIARVREHGRGLAGFVAETCPSVGGQIVFPPGYLAAVYKQVRDAGGLAIADEVQTGLGRMGTSMWAFEDQGVVPDIVVLGKPLGNGHPIGAVVTRREIADAFDNGMEFFSTFGGNNVSCAIGLAVLDVLRDEGLQAHASRVGDRVLAGLRPMMDRYPIVGDVRGSGLFLGVELVRDRETLEPAGDEASYVSNRMREMGILLGTDGPYHNVVKIRPPMPFDDSDAGLLLDALTIALAECS